MEVIHEQSSLDFVNAHNSDLQINQVVGFSLKKVNPQIRCLQFRSEHVGDIYIGEEIESWKLDPNWNKILGIFTRVLHKFVWPWTPELSYFLYSSFTFICMTPPVLLPCPSTYLINLQISEKKRCSLFLFIVSLVAQPVWHNLFNVWAIWQTVDFCILVLFNKIWTSSSYREVS